MTSIPEPVARVAGLMSTFRPKWSLCGGWAVDAWLGKQTRDHGDLDIAVFHDDQRAIFEHLAGWRPIGHDPTVPGDTTEPWDGRELVLPAHIHARPGDGFELEVLLNCRSDANWILNEEPRIAMPLRASSRRSAWRLPTVVPEVLLFYKATAYWGDDTVGDRSRDEVDFFALLPQLSGQQRHWLREAISLLHADHPWLTRLSP